MVMETKNPGRPFRLLLVCAFVCAAGWLAIVPPFAMGAAPPTACKVRTDPEQIRATQRLYDRAERARKIASRMRTANVADQAIRGGLIGLCGEIDRFLWLSTPEREKNYFMPMNVARCAAILLWKDTRAARRWEEKTASLYLQFIRRLDEPGAVDHLGRESANSIRLRAGMYLMKVDKDEEAIAVFQRLSRTAKTPAARLEALGLAVICQAKLEKVDGMKGTLDRIVKEAQELPTRERKAWLRLVADFRKQLP
jgi:hypothetical protein